ncbi:hypothetical protein CGRA01v4_09269 [Colletotrichum graminicola]|nr:hypothetical protein CGRA01v4_09269 [Colletotrichum graminicola]
MPSSFRRRWRGLRLTSRKKEEGKDPDVRLRSTRRKEEARKSIRKKKKKEDLKRKQTRITTPCAWRSHILRTWGGVGAFLSKLPEQIVKSEWILIDSRAGGLTAPAPSAPRGGRARRAGFSIFHPL